MAREEAGQNQQTQTHSVCWEGLALSELPVREVFNFSRESPDQMLREVGGHRSELWQVSWLWTLEVMDTQILKESYQASGIY